ncbi:MAG: bifunctional nuclease family protein [Planctomycetota bacterium]
MSEALERVEIKKIIGPTQSGAAVLLGSEHKTFVIFIGLYEAAALLRELKSEVPQRPLTHELLQSVLLGFDLTIKKVIVTKIVDNAYYATLILEQRVREQNGEWAGRRNEVRIDARPSDCLIMALKNKAELFVTREVLEQAQDFSELLTDTMVSDFPGFPIDSGVLESFNPLSESASGPFAAESDVAEREDDDPDAQSPEPDDENERS